MGGRPRKIVEISTSKNGKQKCLNRKFERDELAVGAPSWLSETAAAEYNRVVVAAKKINRFSNLDMVFLTIYADSYDKYVEASKKIKEYGMTIEYKEQMHSSPFFMVMNQMATQIMECSAKLGLAVTDRLKLMVPTKESPLQ